MSVTKRRKRRKQLPKLAIQVAMAMPEQMAMNYLANGYREWEYAGVDKLRERICRKSARENKP